MTVHELWTHTKFGLTAIQIYQALRKYSGNYLSEVGRAITIFPEGRSPEGKIVILPVQPRINNSTMLSKETPDIFVLYPFFKLDPLIKETYM